MLTTMCRETLQKRYYQSHLNFCLEIITQTKTHTILARAIIN